MEWDKFSFDYKLELHGDIFPSLVMLEGQRIASTNLILAPDWQQQLDKLNRVRAVYGTTALEGNPLSEAEVSEQMEIVDKQGGRADPAKVSKEQLQIRNSGVAQTWAKKRFEPQSPPIDVEDILKMHKMITNNSDMKDNLAGQFRGHEVTVGAPDLGGVHRGAPYSDLSRLMNEYVEFVSSRRLQSEHPVIKALLAHFFLVTIHPFGDGNGRVSRLVEAGTLFQSGYNIHGFYGLSNYFYKNEVEYKTLLQKCRAEQPFVVTPFIQFGVNGFASELEGINNFVKAKINRTMYRAMIIKAYRKRKTVKRRLLNGREYNLLDFLLVETEPTDPFAANPSKKIQLNDLRESKYIQGAYRNVTQRTFFRELVRLGELGFIKLVRDEELKDWIIELDFSAIAKY